MLIDAHKEWMEYRKACFGGQELSHAQDTEMRRAFFAGALITMNLMKRLSDDPEPVAINNLNELRAQVLAQLANGMRTARA